MKRRTAQMLSFLIPALIVACYVLWRMAGAVIEGIGAALE